MLIPALMLMVAACDETDLQKINENPNEPENVSPGVLLTDATRSSMNSMVNESFLLSNNIAQITAKTLRSEVDVYNWNAFSTLWQNQYRALADLEDAEARAAAAGDAATQGAAIVMQSWVYYNLTMAYGDIPYTEAVGGLTDGNFTPAYDTQEDIFNGTNGLLAELQRAANLLGNAGSDVEGDIIYSGSATQWEKLANALQLRILMHLSNKQDVSAQMGALIGQPLMTSNADNATLNYLGAFPNDYPLFPLKQGDFDAVVMSKSAVNLMENYNDPRLGRYARPDNVDSLGTADDSAAIYTGAENGQEGGVCDKGGSRIGLRYYDYPGQPTTDDRANGIIMTYAEQELLLAEAAQKGIAGANAGVHYENGIEASMLYYNVDVASFGWNDFTDFYNNSGVAYTNDLNQIWEQKWLATFFHGMEPFFEVRRMTWETNNNSGFDIGQVPFLTAPCQNVNNGILPVRFLYPGEEQTLNSENYTEAINRIGGSNDQNAIIWIVE